MKFPLLKKIFLLPPFILLAFFVFPGLTHAALGISPIYHMDDPITVNSELVVYWTDAYGWSQKTSGIWYGWYPFDPAPNSSVNYFPASEMGWGPGVHAFGVVDGGVGTAYTPDITIDSAPYDVNGVLEQASCTSISGWACDADTPSSGIQVGVYSRTGPGDPFPVLHATGLANLYRNDLAIHYVCGDPSGYHYFNIPTPSSLKDGVTRKLVVYQIVGGPGLLRGVDIPLTCAPPPVTLTVTKTGTGAGTVTSSPAGINCGADCSESYTSGTAVTLTAAPSAGSIFSSWSGGCNASGQVTMTEPKTCTATFALSTYALTVTKTGTGSGTVTGVSSPTQTNINCGTTCGPISYTSGTGVTLTATPAGGSTFTGWSGACTGTGTCVVTMSAAKSVTATFAGDQPSATLTVYTGPYNSATVGVHDITLTIGEENTKVWSSTGGTSWSSTYSYDNGPCANAGLTGPWTAATAGGSVTNIANVNNSGCTATITYTVTGPGGTASDTIHVTTVAASIPDLQPAVANTVTPTTATVGVSTPFGMQIRNTGDATTGTSFTNRLRKANDAAGTGSTNVSTNTAGPLAAGAQTSGFTISYTPVAGDVGTKWFSICADENMSVVGSITESNEDNNCGAWTAVTVSTATCPNGANNPPTCNTCTSPLVWNGSSCVACTGGCTGGTCNNGATNPPSCSTFPASCTTPWGTTIASGVSVQAFQVPSVNSPAACPASQTLTCTNGTLSGSNYQYSNCVVLQPQAFITANPTRVRSVPPDNTSTISWTLSDTSCTAKRNGVSWNPGPSFSSTNSYLDTITIQTTYTITCTGIATPQSVTVNILPLFQEF